MALDIAGTLGKRFERVLFFGIFVTIACVALMVASAALNAGSERRLAAGYRAFALLVDDANGPLQEAWRQAAREPAVAAEPAWKLYGLRYERLAVDHYLSTWHLVDVGKELTAFNLTVGRKTPAEVSRMLRKMADELMAHPASAFGVTVPYELAMAVGESHVTSSLESVVFVARLVLAPVLILWLGNYIGTRYRELLVIRRSESIIDIHPHLLNCFAVTFDRFPHPAGRLNAVFLMRAAAFVRALIVVVMVFPAVACYTIAVIAYDENARFFIAPLGIIVLQAVMVFLIELTRPAFDKLYYRRVYGES